MNKSRQMNVKDNIIYKHIKNNKKEYVLVSLIFVIGIFLGVMFINNIQEAQMSEVTSYFNNFIEKMKNTEELQISQLLKTSITKNIFLSIILWFFGTTVIGIPIVFAIILYRGFCLGYTISTIISIMGLGKGILFVLITLLLQNIIIIPAIIAIGVSAFKLYKSIVKDRNKDNIKLEVVRHTIFSGIMLVLLCISSLIEILICTNFLKNFIKYF